MQFITISMKVKTFFTKKKIIWTVVILFLLFLGFLIFNKKTDTSGIQTGIVEQQDIQKTVLATGQVVSSTDLDLSLQSSGIVKKVLVKEGDVVSAGQILVVLDQSIALANLESAQGSFSQAQANYNKISAAATTQDIMVSQSAVDAASTTLQNAKQNLVRDLSISYGNVNSSVLSNTNNLFLSPQSSNPQFNLTGTFQTNPQLVYDVNSGRVGVNSVLEKWRKEIEAMTLGEISVDQVVLNSLSYTTTVKNHLSELLNLLTSHTLLSTASATSLTTAQTSITATKTIVDSAYTIITNDNQAVKSAESSLDQAQASLILKKAPARPEDIDIAKAQVLSAEGALHSAQAALNNTVLRAPANGTITQIDTKIGELVQATKEVIKLLNVGELHTEALVSEADIASVSVGQLIDNTFDALGPDKHFTTVVLTVNPASTVISGVVNYKVTGSLEKIPEIKPGMTANMTINVAEKKNVLVIPSSAIINRNGSHYVRVVNNPEEKTYNEVEVETGLLADGGLVEITSGLSAGEEIVTFLK
ncbi:MAG: efflux RND transporter periplasmic adaptor subunit [Patescibacteria group bacterium]